MDVTITKGFTQKTCGTCGVVFFVPDELEQEYVRTNKPWTCPNGHSRSYTESQADKYKRLYEQEQREHVEAIEREAELLDQLEKCQAKNKRTKKAK